MTDVRTNGAHLPEDKIPGDNAPAGEPNGKIDFPDISDKQFQPGRERVFYVLFKQFSTCEMRSRL